MLYNNERTTNVAKSIGISYNSLRKYIDLCLERDLCFYTSTGHLQFRKLSTAINVLLSDDTKNMKECSKIEFFKGFNELKTVKDFQRAIEFAHLKRESDKQLYCIERIRTTYLQLKGIHVIKAGKLKTKLSKLKKKYGLPDYNSVSELITRLFHKSAKKVVTGKFHLSNKIGFSPSTSSKRLKYWHKTNLIKRKVINVDTGFKSCHHSFDLIKEQYSDTYKYLIITGGNIIASIGSEIEIL